MKEFNYQDYLKYQRIRKQEAEGIFELREPEVLYKVHQPHDKIFKIVLDEKNQVVELLNRLLPLQPKLRIDEIEKYNTEYINYRFQKSESDIVYKIKNKEIFFLIEHQRKIDYNMPKRILEYEVEIIKEAVKGRKMTKKDHKLPTVIPIVIYTGSGKWDVENYIKECQEILKGADSIKLGEYYIVDANNYTNEELEKDKLFLYKMLLLEKLKTEKEIFNMLSNTIEKEHREENRIILKRIIAFILEEKLKPQDRENLLKKLEKEDKDMVLEVIRKENERLIKMGKREGIKEGIQKGIQKGKKAIVVKMIKNKMDENSIKLITEITQKELEEIKKTINE